MLLRQLKDLIKQGLALVRRPGPGTTSGPPVLPLFEFPRVDGRYLAIDHHPLPWHAPAGPIAGAQTQAQSFICRRDNLAGLDVYLGTYGRRNQGRLELAVRQDSPDGPVLHQAQVEMAGLADNAPWSVRFEPLAGLQGRELWLVLAAPQAEPDRTVTGWVNSNLAPAGGGRRLAGGKPAAGSLSFRAWFAADRPAWPQMIYLELTNRCNLRCIHCFWEERRDRFSSLDQALLDKVLPALKRAGLVESGGEGELLYDDALSRRSLDFLINAAQGYNLHLTTNGTMLSQPLAERIVASRRVARLFFSVDGATTATYQAIRRGADLAKVVHNIRLVTRRKAELRLPAPGIGLTMVGMRRNVAELPALVDLAAQVGADLVTMLPLIVNRPELAEESLHLHPDLVAGAVAEARRRAEKLGVTLDAAPPAAAGSARRGHRPCWRPWTFAFIGSNGDVLACCNPRSVMGSLTKQSFQEIWLGPAYERLRRRINSAEPPPLCRDCPDHNFRLAENVRSYYGYPVED